MPISLSPTLLDPSPAFTTNHLLKPIYCPSPDEVSLPPSLPPSFSLVAGTLSRTLLSCCRKKNLAKRPVKICLFPVKAIWSSISLLSEMVSNLSFDEGAKLILIPFLIYSVFSPWLRVPVFYKSSRIPAPTPSMRDQSELMQQTSSSMNESMNHLIAALNQSNAALNQSTAALNQMAGALFQYLSDIQQRGEASESRAQQSELRAQQHYVDYLKSLSVEHEKTKIILDSLKGLRDQVEAMGKPRVG